MKTLFLTVAFVCFSVAFSEKKCYIAINSGDCALCLSSYKYINKIDRKLNPILILSNVDYAAADYFVKEYLNINDIPYIIDDDQYKNLVIDKFSLQLKLYDDSTLVYQIPIKELSARIGDLNSFAMNNGNEINAFSIKNFDSINKQIQKRFFGRTNHFIFNEYLSLYSDLSRWFIHSDLKTNTTGSLRLTDSLLTSFIYSKTQIKETDPKRTYYKKAVEGLIEGKIYAFGYHHNSIYLFYHLIDYNKMESPQGLAKLNNTVSLKYGFHLVEININNGIYSISRKLDLSEDCKKPGFSFHSKFSIAEDHPAFFFKTSTNEKDAFEYILLAKDWKRKISEQRQPKLMSKFIGENIFINQFSFNYDKNLLINNQTNAFIKVHPLSLDDFVLTGGSILTYKNAMYFNVLNRQEQKHWVYKVDLTTLKVEILKTYYEMDTYGFYPMFYLEQATDLLYILDINDDKKFYIIDSIKL
jgi:hypothetical protein